MMKVSVLPAHILPQRRERYRRQTRHYLMMNMKTKLHTEWKKGKKKRSHSVLLELMEETRGVRQKWISEERPMVSEVVKKFPPLKEYRMVK